MTEQAAFQTDALAFFDATDGRAIYADDMGGRKTATTLAWLSRNADRTLVVAPRSVHGHWAREAERFHPNAVVLTGTGTKTQRIGRLCMLDGTSVYITTYESMKQDEALLLAAKFDAVVFDEAHRLKGRRTAVALCANGITRYPKHLFLLTGTPVINGAEELWQYLRMLAPSVYRSFWAWAEEHFVIEIRTFRGNRFPTKIIHGFKSGQEHIVRQQAARYLVQRSIEELFPGEVWTQDAEHVVYPVQLSPKERKAYDALVKFAWVDIDGVTVETDNALALSTRLRQLSSEWGTIDPNIEDDGSKVIATVERCHDLLASSEKNLVVFTAFQETANRIVRRLRSQGMTAQPWHGGVDLALREQSLLDFKAGKLQVIVGTLASLGEGVDGLQYGGSRIIMTDRDWTDAKNQQAIGRRRRSGQAHRVVVEHIIAEGTIDDVIIEACLKKTNVVQLLRNRPLKDVVYGRPPIDLGDS